MAFGKKNKPAQPAGPKTSVKVAALWEREENGETRTSGIVLNGLSCRIYDNDYKKADKDPDYKIIAYLPKNKPPAQACREAFEALEAAFKDLGVDVDQALEGGTAQAGGDDVPF
jgi:hypothetical protein